MKCSDCKYFVVAGLPNYGSCHRNPQVLNVSGNYWCGEYQEVITEELVKPRVKKNVNKTASE